ncbi:MAG: OmpA family protein [Muribaculaceae bacterium]|nr:OmpA family protein [Muribaculaceae bacterium]
MVLVLVAVGGTTEVNAQSFLKKLGKKVENATKNAIERNAERKTEDAVDKVFEGDFGKGKKDKDKQNNNGNNNADVVYDNGDAIAQTQPQKGQSLEMTYAKSDFVAGDEIIFEDLLTGEQLGEFPSKWDLMSGVVEIAKLNGENTINFVEDDSRINPLMEDPKNYLPEIFTLEFDFWVPGMGVDVGYHIRFSDQQINELWEIILSRGGWKSDDNEQFNLIEMEWDYSNPSDERIRGENENTSVSGNSWNHFALSFNKRALKIYINGIRIANIPNAKKPQWWSIYNYTWGGFNGKGNMHIKNIRIAKGAVPLYDRMMSDGKFITYGITFDVGKATIKPESMGEINRIVQLMTENPTLKFSVEGHTDSTGNPTSNQTLSEQRSQAIVAKLVELGIAQDRLTAVGKGQNSPIADNNTDEGRAKNRRVEFVKQ